MHPKCPACGAPLRPTHRFCPSCGAPVGPPSTPGELHLGAGGPALQVSPDIDLQEDRRLVSVLFADLSGSTPLGERLDPEDLRRILGAFFAALVRPIHRYEGTVEKYIGDAVMAVFGAPVSHEDDAERAVRAAIEMQSALALLNDWLEREHGRRLALRIGISSGEVVSGLLASEVQSAYTVVGDTVNTAQRLESIATPGDIVVGPTTFRLAGRAFEFEPLGALTLKGKAQTVEAYRVVRSKDEAVALGSTPLVGRSAELALLRRALAGAVLGRGRALTIAGEAGVGKSRLCHEFVERARARGTPVYHVAGQAHAKSVPLMPVLLSHEPASKRAYASSVSTSMPPPSVSCSTCWAMRRRTSIRRQAGGSWSKSYGTWFAGRWPWDPC